MNAKILRIYKGCSTANRFINDKVYEVVAMKQSKSGIDFCVCDEMNRLRTLHFDSMSDCIEQWRLPNIVND